MDHCFFCRAPLSKGRLGNRSKDHAFPTGLGSFDNALTTDDICRACNNRNNDRLEVSLFQHSLITGIKANLRIRSKRSKGEPFRSRLEVEDNKGPNPFARLHAHVDGHLVTLQEAEEGLRVPICFHIIRDGAPPEVHFFSGRTPEQLADQIRQTWNSKDGSQVEIKCHEQPFVERTTALLIASGHCTVALAQERQPVHLRIVGIMEGIFTEEHLQAHAYILCKLMMKAGYTRDVLEPVIAYVQNREVFGQALVRPFSQRGGEGGVPWPDIDEYTHHVQWQIAPWGIIAEVSLFKHKRGWIGVAFALPFRHPRRILVDNIVPSSGSAHAGYHKHLPAGRGWCELILNHRVLQTSRPKPAAAMRDCA